MQKTLGGDRLGSGKKQKVELHNYERSTHDLGYLWRSTMSAGTLVPFLSEVALPGDTFDIKLDCDIKTHPTVGPLFGSYKVQLDIFLAPIRLYNSGLHNNMLGIGRKMSDIAFPVIPLEAPVFNEDAPDIDNQQINPSCLLSYLGIRGIGRTTGDPQTRYFNAIPILAYWEIYKNYYANKQEEKGAVIHTGALAVPETVSQIDIITNGVTETLPQEPAQGSITANQLTTIEILYSGGTAPNVNTLYMTMFGATIPFSEAGINWVNDPGVKLVGSFNYPQFGEQYLQAWRYQTAGDGVQTPKVVTFDLKNIDDMRASILGSPYSVPFEINTLSTEPYTWLTEKANDVPNILNSQEGLACKTYQSDLFNNWLKTEWIDGVGGITEVTAIDTSGGSFTLDTLNLSKKVYNMLNRIAVSGGSYDDWLDAVYTHDRYQRAESPMYMGGLIKEIVFQEVISNSGNEDGGQPLGTLGGRGVMAKKHKGGDVLIRVDEPSYIIGIVSITPRLDYSQGNKWDVHLKTMDDLHKPALDEIGFQELITEQMAWWDTEYNGGVWQQKSAGKQPAWINYMTNVNQTRGNFAVTTNEMFMTLNRRYEYESGSIKDLTTYIDPSKFNFIFANTAIDSQNFWAQIAVDIQARRKMSAKVMPNL